jgi:2,4-dienoyl-CoA reductase-like NADH-dependent reductase (Old Yellow Enzyme family)
MQLFEPVRLRSVTLRNRLGLPPMSQYSADEHRVTSWHLTHYATRAIGPGLVVVEATAVSPQGLVTPQDLGIWDDSFTGPLTRLADVVREQGAVPGIQLSHGGRKGSRTRPWDGDRWIEPEDGGWEVVGPSAIRFADGYPVPKALTEREIDRVIDQFAEAAARALACGYEFLELHAGHGRLLHSFLSPAANLRTDGWGGDIAARSRLLVEVVRAVRARWSDDLPLGVRLSCVDWLEDGWSLDDSVWLSRVLRDEGVDLIDCSSGGIRRPLSVERKPGYQVPFARRIRQEAGIATASVGMIQDLWQAGEIIEAGDSDLVFLGRSMLVEPLQVVRAAAHGMVPKSLVPPQYRRAVDQLGGTARAGEDVPPEL